ncbi:MAG: metallophosphoesterase [Candidatus Margulisbacteria bacterium GWF2_35_9]|nr:MAG: metallophosphoesterase [Candidatus Margulisbacteria bacterium GWF2_35_9]
MLKVLFFGDIVGKLGRECFFDILPELKKKHSPDLIIVNGENSANGRGITAKIYRSYLSAGVTCITSGNHIFDNKEILNNMGSLNALIRPLNYPKNTPGNYIFKTTINGTNIAILNLLGQVFMPPIDNPFNTFEEVLNKELKDSQIIIVDIHAEATSEKKAFAYYFSKRISAVIGTHTHIQTNDTEIIDNHTAYITDVGMLGAKNSILGMEKESIIQRFISNMPERISPLDIDSEAIINYVDMEFEPSGKAKSINAHKIIS